GGDRAEIDARGENAYLRLILQAQRRDEQVVLSIGPGDRLAQVELDEELQRLTLGDRERREELQSRFRSARDEEGKLGAGIEGNERLPLRVLVGEHMELYRVVLARGHGFVLQQRSGEPVLQRQQVDLQGTRELDAERAP